MSQTSYHCSTPRWMPQPESSRHLGQLAPALFRLSYVADAGSVPRNYGHVPDWQTHCHDSVCFTSRCRTTTRHSATSIRDQLIRSPRLSFRLFGYHLHYVTGSGVTTQIRRVRVPARTLSKLFPTIPFFSNIQIQDAAHLRLYARLISCQSRPGRYDRSPNINCYGLLFLYIKSLLWASS